MIRTTVAFLCLIFVVASFPSLVGVSEANAEVRTLKLYFVHTKETASITFKRNGRYVASGLRKLNRFLRDWRRNEPTKMDPKLFDLIWEVYRRTGSNKTITVVSGYRSPKTNAALRRRGRGVATKSQHIRGKALDFFIPGVSIEQIRALGLKAEVGGVGYYRGSFVHLDTGRVRHWPRMSRRQLAKIFPRGRTMHIPSDGKPMAGYKYALARYKKRQKNGGSVLLASASPNSRNRSNGFFKRIFGGGADEAEDNASIRVAAKKPAKRKTTVARASAANTSTRSRRSADSSLPGVNVGDTGVERKRPKQPPQDRQVPDIPILPTRVATPNFRPGTVLPETPDNAIVVAGNDANAKRIEQIIAARFDTSEPAYPTKRPAVANARFALAAVPKPTATERAAQALALSRATPTRRPEKILPDRFKDAAQDDKYTVAMLGAARSITIGGSSPSPTQKALGVTANTSRPATIPSPNPERLKVSLNIPDNTTAEISPVTKPVLVNRIDRAYAALTVNKKSKAPHSRVPDQTVPNSRPVDGFANLRTTTPSFKTRRALLSSDINSAGGRRIKIAATTLQLGNLDGEAVKTWALSHSTRIGKLAKLTAPRYLGVLQNAPIAVSNNGFKEPLRIDRINRFTGQAIKRIEFATFVTAELPRNQVFPTDRY